MKRGIVLFGHGSRDPGWRQPMDQVAQRLRRSAPDKPVLCAFLEAQEPTLEQAITQLVAQGATDVTVFPMFLGVGRHVRNDLPRLVEAARGAHPQVPMHVLPSAGEQDPILDLLAALAGVNPA